MKRKFEYDTKNAKRIIKLLKERPRGLTISEISRLLELNRHTVTKILERLLIEKKVDFEEKGPSKIFFWVGKSKFIGRIDQSKNDKIWIDLFEPIYPEEKFIRINQTRHDSMARTKSKFISVGAVAIKVSKIPELIKILKNIKKD